MAGEGNSRLALIIRSGPCRSRESRAEVDLALAALAIDMEVEIYFVGDAILQLAADKDAAAALLPGGYKAWAALPDLGEVRVCAEGSWVNRLERLGIELCTSVEPLGFARMKRDWRRCNHVMVL